MAGAPPPRVRAPAGLSLKQSLVTREVSLSQVQSTTWSKTWRRFTAQCWHPTATWSVGFFMACWLAVQRSAQLGWEVRARAAASEGGGRAGGPASAHGRAAVSASVCGRPAALFFSSTAVGRSGRPLIQANLAVVAFRRRHAQQSSPAAARSESQHPAAAEPRAACVSVAAP